MIIQRLSQGIKNQDWFVVMVEVMIVVVGIFIGLQVDDWNDERNDRVLERSYYQQLILDLKADQEIVRNAFVQNSRSYAHGKLLYQALTEDDFQISDPNNFTESVMSAGYHTRDLVNRQTYEELTNTGNLRLLLDVALKREVVGYYQRNLRFRQWDMTQGDLQTLFVEQSAGLIPPDVASKVISREKLTVSADEAREILEAARALPNLKRFLAPMLNMNYRNISTSERMIKRSQRLIDLLEKKLEETK